MVWANSWLALSFQSHQCRTLSLSIDSKALLLSYPAFSRFSLRYIDWSTLHRRFLFWYYHRISYKREADTRLFLFLILSTFCIFVLHRIFIPILIPISLPFLNFFYQFHYVHELIMFHLITRVVWMVPLIYCSHFALSNHHYLLHRSLLVSTSLGVVYRSLSQLNLRLTLPLAVASTTTFLKHSLTPHISFILSRIISIFSLTVPAVPMSLV